MRNAIRFVIALSLAICAVKTIAAQITTNPIRDAITKRGLQVEIKDLVCRIRAEYVLPIRM